MLMILYLHKKTKLFKIGNDSLSGLIAIHSGIFAALIIYGRIVVHHIYEFKLMP